MESGLFKAGRILVLVGAILNTVTAALLLIGAMVFFSLGSFAGAEAVVGGSIYLVVGALAVVGAIFGFVAYAKARSGDAHGAWIMGLVSSLLPPVQVVTLVGAILIMTSPEHEAQRAPSSITQGT